MLDILFHSVGIGIRRAEFIVNVFVWHGVCIGDRMSRVCAWRVEWYSLYACPMAVTTQSHRSSYPRLDVCSTLKTKLLWHR